MGHDKNIMIDQYIYVILLRAINYILYVKIQQRIQILFNWGRGEGGGTEVNILEKILFIHVI